MYHFCLPQTNFQWHFESFLPSTYRFGTVYTLVYGYFQICSSWTKLPTELPFLKLIFLENGHPENVINRCFKRFMDSMHVLKETTLTVESKPLVFSSLKLENGLEKQVLNGA